MLPLHCRNNTIRSQTKAADAEDLLLLGGTKGTPFGMCSNVNKWLVIMGDVVELNDPFVFIFHLDLANYQAKLAAYATASTNFFALSVSDWYCMSLTGADKGESFNIVVQSIAYSFGTPDPKNITFVKHLSFHFFACFI